MALINNFRRCGFAFVQRAAVHTEPRSTDAKTPKVDSFPALCKKAGVRPQLSSIGAGNMAKALINGFIRADLMHPPSIGVCDPMSAALESFKLLGCQTDTNNDTILTNKDSTICMLAVKPQYLESVMETNAAQIAKCGIVVSVVAGVTIAKLQSLMKVSPRDHKPVVIRVMPNTPALVGRGATVFACSSNATEHHAAIANSLFSTVGSCSAIDESLIDAVTGLSGSGPAYVYTMIDAMADGGVKMGLSRPLAVHLAAQTVMGAAEMVLKTNESPMNLRAQVCSPSGTTIAGVHTLESFAVRNAFMCAVESATKRAMELGKEDDTK